VSEEGAPARAPGPSGWSNFTLRVLAALIMAPLALLIAFFDGWPWALLAIAAGVAIFAEWLRMTGPKPLWLIGGLVYAGAPALAAILLRADRAHGFAAIVFVLAVVWASDSFGYLAGRAIGGPKLWPRVSPKKTWAGSVGALIGSAIVGGGFALAGYAALPLALLGAGLSIVAQAGDLLESAIKRHFGVKDSGALIPGHGGVMDRLDAFVAVIVLATLLGFARSNDGAAASGLMLW